MVYIYTVESWVQFVLTFFCSLTLSVNIILFRKYCNSKYCVVVLMVYDL